MEGKQPIGAFAIHFEKSQPLIKPDSQRRTILEIQPEGTGMSHHFFIHGDDLDRSQLTQQPSDGFVTL